MKRKQLPAEALVDLRRRLANLAPRSAERRVLMLNYMTGDASLARELRRHRFSAKVKGFKKRLGL